MPEPGNKFYVTTPIYYVNARPHIGHAYSTIAADVLARRHRLLGEDVFFLTGTDEHGQKVQRSAEAAGVPPQQFADEVSATFRALWKRMGITNDDFIRTTEERHKLGVQKLWRVLKERGDIYLSTYTGQYSVGEEMFVEGPPGTIGPDGKPTETVTEENYFFRLSAYQEKLIELIEGGGLVIQPEAVKNEVLSFVRGGLKDLSISRTTFDWGIPVPGNPKHVVYVWLDALANYITALGYGADDPKGESKFQKYWPADIHLVGKEITRFHCVYWPAFLMAAGLPVPESVVANGWLLFEESKMSKSRGNVVRTETILDAFGEHYRASLVKAGQPEPDKRDCDLWAADVLRYFLLREIPFGQDGSFSFDAMITRYNADLANGYGNLVSRTLAMLAKYFGGVVPDVTSTHLFERFGKLDRGDYSMIAFGPEEVFRSRRDEAYAEAPMAWHWAYMNSDSLESAFGNLIERFTFSNSLEVLSWGVTQLDGFITRHVPWKIAAVDEQEAREALKEIIYTSAQGLCIITALLYPVLPHTTAKVWAQLGLGDIEAASQRGELKNLQWGGLEPGTKLGPLAPIFPRAPKELAQSMSDMESANTPQKPTPVPPGPSPLSEDFDDVAPKADKQTDERPEPGSSGPGAAPRTSSIAAENPGAHVGGSAALTTERAGTPPHAEAQASGVFAAAKPETPQITIDDFVKIDLRVAKVVVAERIPKADKLLRLEVDLGYERRQILSGIAQWYTPEELLGRRIAVIANLAPRKMRGLDSHGMLLAASDEADPNGKPILASFSDEIPLGSRIR